MLRFDGQSGQFIDAFVEDDPATAENESGGLSGARAIAFGPEGDLYVDDGPRNRVLRYDGATGRFIGVATGGSEMRGPVGLTFGADGTMFVGGGTSGAAYAFRGGVMVRRYACPGQTAITGVLIGADGRLYAADPGRDTVYRFDVTTGDCLGAFASGAGLSIPIGLAWAPDGNLLVGSFNTSSVIKYDRVTGASLGTFVQPGAGGLSGTHNFAFVPAVAPPPILNIVTPSAGAVITAQQTFTAGITDFELDCTTAGSVNVAGRGRIRIDVDGQFDSHACHTFFQLAKSYAAGAHVVTVALVNNDGTPLSPPVADSVDVVIVPEIAFVPRLIVPGVARLGGVGGSFFRTTMWMTNPETTSMIVRLRFFPGAGLSDGGPERFAIAALAPGQMIRYGDVLSDAFGFTTGTGGVVLIETAEATAAPVVAARTFNDTAGGTLGQYIPAVPISDGRSEIRLHGLAGDGSSRTNVGVVNVSGSPMTAVLSLGCDRRPAGLRSQRHSGAVGVIADQWLQPCRRFAGRQQLQRADEYHQRDSVSLCVETRQQDLRSDLRFTCAIAIATVAGRHRRGDRRGRYVFSIVSFSRERERRTGARIDRLHRAWGHGAAQNRRDRASAGQTTSYRDVMQELFQMEETAGTLMVSTDADTPVTAWARTYNDRGEAGTLGQFIPSFGAENLIGPRGGLLPGISENQAVRCNLGMVNTSAAAADVLITAYGVDGQPIAAKTYRVEGGQTVSVGRILRDLGAGQQNDTYLIVKSSVPNALYAWASFIDNKSTDPTFVRPFILP